VNSSVLIPRPETELLVEEIINHYKEAKKLNILDIGTGSGNIAVALAHNLPNSRITATDISKEALEIAEKNSVMNRTENQVNFVQNDILTDKFMEINFDVIVSNPPYVSVKDYEELCPELKVYEPRQALTDDSDGLIYYRAITSRAGRLLKSKGRLFYEIGKGQSEEVKTILEESNFSLIQIRNDYLNIERVISGELI
jgi:release factor glutamine methyltransferase